MQRLRFLTLFLALALCVPLLHAATYGVTIVPDNNDISLNETATYHVTVSNFGDTLGQFQVYTIDPAWSVKTVPLTPLVEPHAQGTFLLSMRPTKDVEGGAQGVSLTFKDILTGASIKKDVVVSVRYGNLPRGVYEPTVALDIAMPYDLDPRNPVPLRLQLRNRNALNISNLTITVDSPHFTARQAINLGPLSERTLDITGLSVDPLTPPTEEEVTVQLIYQNEVVNQLVKNYRIKEYTSIRQRITEEAFFFKTERSVHVTNDGNVKNTALVTVPTSFLKSLFVSSDVPYERTTQDGNRILLWTVPLDPNQTKEFTYTENYRILILLILLALLGGLSYLLLRSPVVVVKEAVGIAKGDGVSHIKVRVFIKNRSAKLIRSIQVTDRVPSLADVLSAESPGSLTPAKVASSEKQGTLLRWELEVLEPYEERVLTYHARSKLKIIGKMSLPNAKVRFTMNGKERVVYSNNIELIERFRDR